MYYYVNCLLGRSAKCYISAIMTLILDRQFFNRDTSTVAQELLGKRLVRDFGNRKLSVFITETESYDGFYDTASHASKGLTKRNAPMFGNPGKWYVYLCYGMHFMLNIVTREAGYPAAVLIRGAIDTDSTRILFGPGVVTKWTTVDKTFNNTEAIQKNGLWIEDVGRDIFKKNIINMRRIGVAYATPRWAKRKLRFVLKNPLSLL